MAMRCGAGAMVPAVARTIVIQVPRSAAWAALTDPGLMRQWMGEPETMVDVSTDWTVGGPILIRGFHHARFENKGTVLRFEPPEVLAYSHLSSLSRLPDKPESYSVFEFRLEPVEDGTSLTVILTGFPTESILKHLDFYWRGTLGVLKRFLEGTPSPRKPQRDE